MIDIHCAIQSRTRDLATYAIVSEWGLQKASLLTRTSRKTLSQSSHRETPQGSAIEEFLCFWQKTLNLRQSSTLWFIPRWLYSLCLHNIYTNWIKKEQTDRSRSHLVYRFRHSVVRCQILHRRLCLRCASRGQRRLPFSMRSLQSVFNGTFLHTLSPAVEISVYTNLHCVSKTTLFIFNFCKNFVGHKPILIIFWQKCSQGNLQHRLLLTCYWYHSLKLWMSCRWKPA